MNERPRLPVLALLTGRIEAARPLLAYLERSGQLTVDVVTEVDRLRQLSAHAVVLALTEEPLGAEPRQALLDFANRGGGVVGLHATLAAGEAAAARTELLIKTYPGHPITDRMPAELRISDRLPLRRELPEGATLLLSAHWHYDEIPLMFERRLGRGRIVELGLGGTEAALADRFLHQLVFRSLRHAAAVQPAPPVGVGMVGYGAIAREHAEAIRETAGLELRSICDRSADRRQAAERDFGVVTSADAEQLLADPVVELVVIGTPPNAHASGVVQALEAGRHVVCEKPFALKVQDVHRMVAAAAVAGRVLTVYQSRRWDPDFVALQAAVKSGRIGEVFYMESFIGGFAHPCSYWHSHEPISGGTIFDWGSHYFDWVLQLFDTRRVRSVTASAHKRVWHDVSNSDQVRVDLRFDDGAEASFLQSDVAAALKPKWYLLGTAGAILGDWRAETINARDWTGALTEEHLAPADSPARLSIHSPDGSVEDVALPARERNGFYGNLADHLLQGEPLAVPPEEAGRNVAVMEAAARSIAAGGRMQEVDL